MDKTEKLLSELVEKNNTPSVQYICFDQDNIIRSFHKGFADISEHRYADPAVTYNAFSVTKTFTALAILQLFEKGLVDINKPAILYLPEFPYGSEITVKQLMNHTAGIPNPIPISWIHLDSDHKSFDRHIFFNQIFQKNNKVKSKPNEKFAYSNLGFILLGQLIEKVSGKSYEEYISENIFQKLPINSKDLTFTIVIDERHAKGYHKKLSFSNLVLGLFIDKSIFMDKTAKGWRSFNNFYVNGTPYGGMIGKPSAFVKYIQSLLKDDNNLISNEFKQLLFQENKTNKGEKTGMCLSWFAGELNGNKYYSHAGGGGGYYCELRIYPDIKKGSVIFFNRSGFSDERFLDNVDRYQF